MTSSRYVRPARPPNMQITRRDIELLRYLSIYKYLTTEQLYNLLFDGLDPSVIHRRLRLLWMHKLAERIYLAVGLKANQTSYNNKPVYTLALGGAQLIASHDDLPVQDLYYYKNNKQPQDRFIEHHLVVMDLIVSLAKRSREQETVKLIRGEHEGNMRRQLKAWRGDHNRGQPTIVSDGIIELEYADQSRKLFHVEIVRASIQGGNKTFFKKLELYIQLYRQGFFKELYGQDHIRAVLILTTSPLRAEILHRLAQELKHGKRFFWFASYDEQSPRGVPSTSLRANSILEKVWIDGVGDRHTLLNG